MEYEVRKVMKEAFFLKISVIELQTLYKINHFLLNYKTSDFLKQNNDSIKVQYCH